MMINHPFKIGQRVTTGIYVGGEFMPMCQGDVVAVHDGFCEIDRMSLHGGAPWIVYEAFSNLQPASCAQ
jgi:hypothetical protein